MSSRGERVFNDWSQEIATTVMPAVLATMGVVGAWRGIIDGVSERFSSSAKMASGEGGAQAC